MPIAVKRERRFRCKEGGIPLHRHSLPVGLQDLDINPSVVANMSGTKRSPSPLRVQQLEVSNTNDADLHTS